MPRHRPPWIPLYQFLMNLPGTLAVFGLLLRSDLFLRSSMGFGGCFVDMRLLEGPFHDHVVAPLLASPSRMEGMREYLRGATWGPVDALEHEHARLTMPVLLVWGGDDPTFPIERARAMVSQFPDARLVEIAGARSAGSRREARRGRDARPRFPRLSAPDDQRASANLSQ